MSALHPGRSRTVPAGSRVEAGPSAHANRRTMPAGLHAATRPAIPLHARLARAWRVGGRPVIPAPCRPGRARKPGHLPLSPPHHAGRIARCNPACHSSPRPAGSRVEGGGAARTRRGGGGGAGGGGGDGRGGGRLGRGPSYNLHRPLSRKLKANMTTYISKKTTFLLNSSSILLIFLQNFAWRF